MEKFQLFKKLSLYSFFLMSFLAFNNVMADDLPAPGKLTIGGGVKVGAYVDSYYTYNVNRPPLSQDVAAAPQNNHRSFDLASRQMQVGQARVGISHDANPFGFDAQFGFGSSMDALNTNRWESATDRPYAAIRKATINWASDAWSFDIGRLDANLGLERIDAVDNWNYSRSLQFTLAQPKFFTGLHAGYGFTSGWGVHLGIANGIDRYSDNNIAKTGFGGFSYSNSDTSFNLNVAIGPEKNLNSTDYRYSYFTSVKHTYSETIATGFDASFVMGNSEFVTKSTADTAGKIAKVKYFGGALYGAFSFLSDHWDTLRAEFLKDSDGAATLSGTGRNLISATLTHRANMTKNFSLWVEGRWDNASQKSFTTSDGVVNNTNSQITATVAGTMAI